MHLQYRLEGAGWATVVVGDGSHHVSMPVSYLHDSLHDLGSAVLALHHGAMEVTVTFVDEPGEHHLFVTRNVDGSASVEVRWFDDHPPRNLDQYEVVFRGHSTARELCDEVRASMATILESDGLDGYLAKWKTAPFPSEEFAALGKVG